MDNIVKMVEREIKRGWTGPNLSCKYHPCHFVGQDCTFCFCPFYPCHDHDLGESIDSKRGKGHEIWSCTNCLMIHRPEVCKDAMGMIHELGITTPEDKRMNDVFKAIKERHYHRGKAIMVLGATSDAGKSLLTAAICRVLHKRGYLVSPFKSQNMSLNSTVTMDGCEVALAQYVQSVASGHKHPDRHVNPILLKPKGDATSQVVLEGKPHGDFHAGEYYSKFVKDDINEVIGRNVDFLKSRYDYVIVEGAGSPAEINLYTRDLANIRTAKISEADCILSINASWGGSVAYAIGTLALIPDEDRGLIKGVILNNVKSDPSEFKNEARLIEEMTGVPVIGIIPHGDFQLPSEDSESLRNSIEKGTGRAMVSVIKYPRIANFSDLDPLLIEDLRLQFVTRPEELEGSDAIVLPGTKNTINDLQWLKDRGLFDAIKRFRGKVPIVGICGGYQMMGEVLSDPTGIEGSVPGDFEGLGFFRMRSTWGKYEKKITKDFGTLISTGEEIEGYELHMGMSEVDEAPLFKIKRFKSEEMDGAVREDEMLFGTYIHGIFDRPAFRRYLLRFIRPDGRPMDPSNVRDYAGFMDENLDKLADLFESNVDFDRIMDLLEGGN